jgi:hypothetical protein
MKQLFLLCCQQLTEQEQRLLKLAGWMGVRTNKISITNDADAAHELLGECDRSQPCVALSLETLAAVRSSSCPPSRLLQVLERNCTELLVFGCTDSTEHGSTLSWLTSGAVRSVQRPEAIGGSTNFHFPAGSRSYGKQFAGITFWSNRESPQFFDVDVSNWSAEPVMLANNRPVFIRAQRPSGIIFLISGSEIPDIDQALSRSNGIEEYYSQIIPILIVFRCYFGENCWHGRTSSARLIIDDPLLERRYGCLDYPALLASMCREHFGTSIAFIPWNYWRTSRKAAARFSGKEKSLSLCVHGCDHSNMEFDTLDHDVLTSKASLGLERMHRHQLRTTLPFEKVMVFPQGRFSASAMQALRSTGYLAAVNSTCLPTYEGQNAVTIADMLRPAVTRFYGFPIFVRHYPRQLIDFAFDLFLGKPALIVEHHQYFNDGCKALEGFVAELSKIEPELTWPTLSSQLIRNFIMRRVSDDFIEVRFFTRRFQLTNWQTTACRFALQKHEPDPSLIRTILVDGRDAPIQFNANSINLEIEIGPGQTGNIEILDHPVPTKPASRARVAYSFGVLVRRGLSEFRDKGLARHPGLLSVATALARNLKATGERKN